MNKKKTRTLLSYYKKLLNYFGPRNWWPGETPFEIIVGAILTQNTNWINVEKAIANLKSWNLLSPEKLYQIDTPFLANIIRPTGYYNIKAKRLKSCIKWLVENYQSDIQKLKEIEEEKLREELLTIRGIGQETADSILLYALGKPTFVVDTYTYRLFSRHKLIPEETTYEEIKEFFQSNLPRDAKLYNDYHAQIVEVGKNFCRRKPLCDKCPLKIYLPSYQPNTKLNIK